MKSKKSKSKEPPKNAVRIKFGDVEVEAEGERARQNAEELFDKVQADYKKHWERKRGAMGDYR